jgi:hypothetical protein
LSRFRHPFHALLQRLRALKLSVQFGFFLVLRTLFPVFLLSPSVPSVVCPSSSTPLALVPIPSLSPSPSFDPTMSFSASDLTSVVETAMAAGANPFEALDAVMWSTLDKGLPESFFIQLYCLAGGLGVCVLFLFLLLRPHNHYPLSSSPPSPQRQRMTVDLSSFSQQPPPRRPRPLPTNRLQKILDLPLRSRFSPSARDDAVAPPRWDVVRPGGGCHLPFDSLLPRREAGERADWTADVDVRFTPSLPSTLLSSSLLQQRQFPVLPRLSPSSRFLTFLPPFLPAQVGGSLDRRVRFLPLFIRPTRLTLSLSTQRLPAGSPLMPSPPPSSPTFNQPARSSSSKPSAGTVA